LRGDIDTVEVDGVVAIEVFERDSEGIIRWREGGSAGYGCVRRSRILSVVCELTIVDDDAWNTKSLLHLIESLDHIFGLGEVARDVQLTLGTVCFFHRASGKADFVALRGKLANHRLPNVGTCAEDEGDWRSGCHCFVRLS
jgi:hypothetical protein